MQKILSKIDFSYVYSFLGEATLALTLLLYMLIGRAIGPEQYGVFTAANALAGILGFFILFGFPDLLSREIAANPKKGLKSTTTFLLIESLNGLLILLCLFPLAQVFGFEGNGIIVCYLVVIAGGGRCTKQTLRAVFRGLGKFRSETISVAIERTALFLLASATLFITHSLPWVVGAIAFVRVIDTLCLLYYLKRKEPISSPITLKNIKKSFKMAYPFAISGVLWILYYQVDALMLKTLSTSQEVGLYGAAYELLAIFSALPRVIFSVYFPKLTKCYAQDPSQLPEKIRQAAILLLAVVLPVITIAGFSRTLIINLSYGEAYLPAIGALTILLPSLSMKMFASLVSYVFQATRREKLLPFVLLATVVINILANAILIPQMGAVGAALATLLSEVIFAVVGLVMVIRVGYRQIGFLLLIVATLNLTVASIPTLMFYGLNPAVAVGLMAVSLSAIALLMRRSMNPAI